MTKRTDAEDRKQQRLRRFGTNHPRCVVCGESDPSVLDLHHIAGQVHSDDRSIVCANHHRKLSEKQRDHVPPGPEKPRGQLEEIGHYLLGLAELLEMTVGTLRTFGTWLIAASRRRGSK